MAKFECAGLSKYIRQLEDLNLYDDKIAEQMLDEIGEDLEARIKSKMDEYGHVVTGQTKDHVKLRPKLRTSKEGLKYVIVSVSGKRKETGQKNAAVAFIMNYGRRSEYGEIVGSHFWNRAVEESEKKAEKIVETAVEKWISEKGFN